MDVSFNLLAVSQHLHWVSVEGNFLSGSYKVMRWCEGLLSEETGVGLYNRVIVE